MGQIITKRIRDWHNKTTSRAFHPVSSGDKARAGTFLVVVRCAGS